MRFTVEKEIVRYPAGVETARPPQTVSGIGFLQYNLGGGLLVWRTPDQTAEVGLRGGGATYYVRINGIIANRSFTTLRSAMQAAVALMSPASTPYA